MGWPAVMGQYVSMDDQLRFNAQMIMLGVLADSEPAGRRHHRRDAQIIAASRSTRPRRVARARSKHVLDDAGSLGVVDVEELSGLWLITMSENAQPSRIFHDLVAVLRALEDEFGPDRVEQTTSRVTHHRDPSLHDLGVVTARRSPGPGGGKIRIAADVLETDTASSGPAFAAWVGAYLLTRDDLVGTQERTGDLEQSVFVWIRFGGAPWVVESFLADLPPSAPTLPPIPAPDLPDWVAQVWVAVEYSDTGCRWDGRAWRPFQVRP
jgi:hypothetical protein